MDRHNPTEVENVLTNALESRGGSSEIRGVFAPILAEMEEAERIFVVELGSRSPFVQQLINHCADFRGKRLRPALLLLSGHACQGLGRSIRSWLPS